MKKIVRLTESDLARIVKRVITESKTTLKEGNGSVAFNMIKGGMSGLGTDENKVAKGVYAIKNKADYMEALSLVKKAGYKSLMCWIGTDMGYSDEYDETQAAPIADWGQQGNNPYLKDFQRHLQQFNPNEKICVENWI